MSDGDNTHFLDSWIGTQNSNDSSKSTICLANTTLVVLRILKQLGKKGEGKGKQKMK